MKKVMQQVEVAITEDGQIDIKQDDPVGNDGSVVRISPDQVDTLCQWLQDAKKQASPKKSRAIGMGVNKKTGQITRPGK